MSRTNGQRPVYKPANMDEAIEVKVARVHEDFLPTRGSIHAAGWDLYALEDTEVLYRTATLVRTGLHVAIPVGYEGQVRARSSLGKRIDSTTWNWHHRCGLSWGVIRNDDLDWRRGFLHYIEGRKDCATTDYPNSTIYIQRSGI